MIFVTAKNQFDICDIDKVIFLFSKLVEETRKESGCIKYELFQDIKNKGIITIIEQWQDKESLDAHFMTEHYTNLIPQIVKMAIKDKDVNIYEKII